MLDTILTIVVITLGVFLLSLLIGTNIKEWYDPYIDVTQYDKDGKRLVILWYNHVTDEDVKREHKVLFKI